MSGIEAGTLENKSSGGMAFVRWVCLAASVLVGLRSVGLVLS